MISMTGYGHAEHQDAELHVSVELKSFNNRYLDCAVNLPSYLSPLEQNIRSFLTGKVKRGRVEVSVRIRELEEDVTVLLDRNAVRAYRDVLEELRKEAGIQAEISLDHFLQAEGILKIERNRDPAFFWSHIEPYLQEAFTAFDQVRRSEGNKTQVDIEGHLAALSRRREIVARHAEDMEAKIRSDLVDRYHTLLGESAEPDRIYAELAVQLNRLSISEELARMQGHLDTFNETLQIDMPQGKKLDFLCQEIHREINTIGSKSILLPVNQAVVEMKDALENIREQLRNVE